MNLFKITTVQNFEGRLCTDGQLLAKEMSFIYKI